MALIEQGNKNVSVILQPGNWMVDSFPILRHIPEWMLPGGGFKAIARKFAEDFRAIVDMPFQYVEEKMVGHSAHFHHTTNAGLRLPERHLFHMSPAYWRTEKT